MPKKVALTLLVLLSTFMTATAQRPGISNNALLDLAGALSAGVELPCSPGASIDIYGSLRPWKRGNQSVHKHWLIQAQYRIWPCQVMNGFFFGPYVHTGEFNIARTSLPFGLLNGLKSRRYEGWLAGAGFGIGYEYAIARHWNIGAEAGIGYTYINYKKFNCETCGTPKGSGDYHYIGLSRLGLNLIYVF